MSLINKQEINKLIAFHENQIDVLKRLLDISDAISGGTTLTQKDVSKLITTSGKTAKRGRGRPKGKKRGSVSNAIIDTLAQSKQPLRSGDIRDKLVAIGVIAKGSTAIYAMLLQMSKRGSIKKSKTAKGIAYSSAARKISK